MAGKLEVRIEYCAEWGYEGHAARVAEELLEAHAENIASLTIVPSSGGRFLVTAGEKSLFNKKEIGRFPNKGEAAQLLARTL